MVATGAGLGVVALTTVGQTLAPLEPIALLAPRRPSRGPQHVPINRTADQAGVRTVALSPDYRLTVLGPNPFDLDLAALEALPTVERDLPIACVEGWSIGARWAGPRLLDLVRRAGGSAAGKIVVVSLEPAGAYRASTISGPQLRAALLATHLNGERLSIDHGYPVRLIAPDRAGVFNTKWVSRIEVRP